MWLYVIGLPVAATSEELGAVFAGFGTVNRAFVFKRLTRIVGLSKWPQTKLRPGQLDGSEFLEQQIRTITWAPSSAWLNRVRTRAVRAATLEVRLS
jgi:hypothetical protein